MPAPMTARATAAGLDVGLALRQGWRAFQRAPLSFVVFSLLVTALQAPGQLLLTPLLEGQQSGPGPSDWWLAAGGALWIVLVHLWSSCGFVRASWSALEGRRPTPACFLLPDLRALGRVAAAELTLAGLGFGAVLLLAFVEAAVSLTSQALALMVALLPLPGLAYLIVSQRFLVPIALLEGPGSLATLERGRRVVDPRWGSVLGLTLAQIGLLLLGGMALLVGVFAALPVIACSSTAAYRQLFGERDRTGLLARQSGSD
jgi:hypothetical protein